MQDRLSEATGAEVYDRPHECIHELVAPFVMLESIANLVTCPLCGQIYSGAEYYTLASQWSSRARGTMPPSGRPVEA